jgi:hypothetical protein
LTGSDVCGEEIGATLTIRIANTDPHEWPTTMIGTSGRRERTYSTA